MVSEQQRALASGVAVGAIHSRPRPHDDALRWPPQANPSGPALCGALSVPDENGQKKGQIRNESNP